MLRRVFSQHPDDIIVGVDEAGRGCLFGPVFAAAVVWNPACTHPLQEKIKDSNKLSKKMRMQLKEFIEANAVAYCVSSCDHAVIDEINILKATHRAMHQALEGLCAGSYMQPQKPFDRILVDGNAFTPFKNVPHDCIVGGDNHYLQIAAASILAKTHHDLHIEELLRTHPDLSVYGLDSHMGYGTAVHIKALATHGPSAFHRKSFKKVCQ